MALLKVKKFSQRTRTRFFFPLLLSFAGWILCARVNAQEVIAVLSSDSQPYQEALAGFKESYNGPLRVITISKEDSHIPDSANVIVTFGGKAGLYPYPQNAILIYCL